MVVGAPKDRIENIHPGGALFDAAMPKRKVPPGRLFTHVSRDRQRGTG